MIVLPTEKVKAKVQEINKKLENNAIREKIKETGRKPYKYITIDNATRLEEICLPYAGTL